ncbi:hypothetical protein AB0G73_36520 [Streptomyces sp. NPDC020719]|uniref:hypothetical protein n=1 Tax=Streptomyces sp. NPDC020719 TaxID=3154896 RepID=UPI0033D6C3F5
MCSPRSLPSIKGVQVTEDFEGYIELVLSLGEHTRYNVLTLTALDRIVSAVGH